MLCEGQKIMTLADLCAAMAPVFTALGFPAPSATDVLEQLAKEKNARVNVLKANLNSQSTRRHERTLLRDEKGNAYGEVRAEIPMELYNEMKEHPSFGPEELGTKQGIAALLKTYPQCGVKNVGLKHHGHSQTSARRFGKINWGGRMQFVK